MHIVASISSWHIVPTARVVESSSGGKDPPDSLTIHVSNVKNLQQ